jgi:peptide/nickel transport system substrate-binding protein
MDPELRTGRRGKPALRSAHVPTFEVFQRHFRGWRIVSRDPADVEVYSDQIYPDAETIVAVRTPGVLPWHTLALGVRAEQAGELAFSSNKSDRIQVDQLNMVAGPSLRIFDRHLQAAEQGQFVPYAEVLGA